MKSRRISAKWKVLALTKVRTYPKFLCFEIACFSYTKRYIPLEMKITFGFILIFLFTGFGHLQGQTIFIKSKSYLDVRAGKITSPTVLEIKDGVILDINPEFIADSTEFIDLGDLILLPGLMDMHVHLDRNSVAISEILKEDNNELEQVKNLSIVNANKTLKAGFTTVRNLGQMHEGLELIDVHLSEKASNENIKCPTIIPSGHKIDLYGNSEIEDTISYLKKRVTNQIKGGAKCIKIISTHGLDQPHIGFKGIKFIVSEAKKYNIPTAAHAHDSISIYNAIVAGVRSIEHGSMLSDNLIKLMIDSSTFLVPTIACQEKAKLSFMKPSLRKKIKELQKFSNKQYKKAINQGVNFAMGSDAPLIPHGENALELLAINNLIKNPLLTIQSATINAAKLLNLTDRGEIKHGMIADIIGVCENPLENINTLTDVRFVMKEGEIVIVDGI